VARQKSFRGPQFEKPCTRAKWSSNQGCAAGAQAIMGGWSWSQKRLDDGAEA